jgi:serine/threonine-protein kinase HipA
MTTNKKIHVYADWEGLNESILMGILSAEVIRGKEIFSFEYSKEWLKSGHHHNIDPHLHFFTGPQYNNADKPNFGLFLDSSPDRWGRVLMKRREAIIARKEDRKPKTLLESDFLLGVYDENRMGGLRFKIDPEEDFLSAEKELAAPPFATIRDLEFASLQLEKEKEVKDDEALKWLNMLMAPGASLGGARPKASVRDTKGHLWIAKFPSGNDDRNMGAWEQVAMQIARDAGIQVGECDARKFSNKYHTFLSKRFDRTDKGDRIHFASAMTLLGYNDGTDFQSGVSYLELAEYLMQHGAQVDRNLRELWTRIVLNICIKNTDDHLRNHGFLLTESGWVLSPIYDVNPFHDGTGLTLNISEDDNSLDLELAMSVAEKFRLKEDEANAIISRVRTSVSNWKRIADSMNIPRGEQRRMETAFFV